MILTVWNHWQQCKPDEPIQAKQDFSVLSVSFNAYRLFEIGALREKMVLNMSIRQCIKHSYMYNLF